MAKSKIFTKREKSKRHPIPRPKSQDLLWSFKMKNTLLTLKISMENKKSFANCSE